MKITIKRHWFTKNSSIGTMRIDDKTHCFTLEDCARARGVKIPKETAIPEGEYAVTIDFSQRFQRAMPHILDVPGFEGVRFHRGNKPDESEGCIMLGYQKGSDTIWECKAFDDFFSLLQESIFKFEPVTLTIENEQL